MKHFLIILAAFCSYYLNACSPSGSGQNIPELDSIHFVRRSIIDRSGFGTEAYSILLPSDWSFNGSLVWEFNAMNPIPRLEVTASNPEGSAILEHIPTMRYAWTSDQMMNQAYARQGLTIMQPLRLESFFKNLYLPNARLNVDNLQLNSIVSLPEEALRVRKMSEYLINTVFHSISPLPVSPVFRPEAAFFEVSYTHN